ncbi:AAA family ATPase [Kocuria dechangensis]|nr:AAA family ATPase [Kocuria dechangensis]
MFTPKDLHIDPAARAAIPERPVTELEVGSITSQALFSIFQGEAATTIVSPPGGGKSTCIGEIAVFLLEQTDLKFEIACPTRDGAWALAAKIGALMAERHPGEKSSVLFHIKMDPPENVATKIGECAKRRVGVRTLASAAMSQPELDLLIVDEAFQTTYAQLAVAADKCEQILMVGDSGQIGPVVTSDTRVFASRAVKPESRAPEPFIAKGYPVLNIDRTFRLGPDTVDAIAPLYDFDFASARPEVSLRRGRRTLPEITSIAMDPVDTPEAFDVAHAVADRAEALLQCQVHTEVGATAMTPAQLAVVVAHNAQVSAVAAVLEKRGIEGTAVGTADSLQGGQWNAVIAVDPLTGYREPKGHQLHPGRLCVMASRHIAHLSWIHPVDWAEVLDTSEDDVETIRAVRESLTA